MIQAKRLQDSLLGLVGWRQNDTQNPDLQLSALLLGSESGLYYQQAHPLLTLDNIASIAPTFDDYFKPDFSANVEYKYGDVVKREVPNGKFYYKAIHNTTFSGVEPDVTAGWNNYWVETTPFSEWLEDKTRTSIYKTIYRYLNEKQKNGTYNNLLEDRILFDTTTRITDKIANHESLVGFEVIPARAKGVTIKVNKIGLHFTTPGVYTLYVMHSSSQRPIYTLQFTKTQANTCEWFKTDNLYLPYINSGNDLIAGSWYICYIQSELPAGSQAINRAFDWSGAICRTCNRRDHEAYIAWSKYMEINPFKVNAKNIEHSQPEQLLLWDAQAEQYFNDKTWGLNLDITVGCDLTDFIIDQRGLFQDVLMKQMAVDILREFVYNPNARTNRHSINASKTDILYEIDGDSASMRESGLSYELKLAYNAVKLTTSGINRVCLPCNNGGIRYKPI